MKVISICLSDLPKEKITTAKNGKKYISLVVDSRKTPDNYGNDQTVYVQQTKEERIAKTAKIYVGQGKSYNFNNNQPAQPTTQSGNDDDLPF